MDLKQYRFAGDGTFRIKEQSTLPPQAYQDKEKAIKKEIKKDRKTLQEAQEKLYAQNQFGVLILFQAMDAAGKDGMIKHVMRGVNPQGTTVTPFKVPTADELAHDYLWRTRIAFPRSGEIAIFNRSYYEEVLVDRVHPENVLKEHLPNVNAVSDVNDALWHQRYQDFKDLEAFANRNGIVILKFFLHLSKAEQKKRFLARIEIPEKNWKFSENDINERQYWDQYQKAYEEAIQHTATKENPWYVIPADDKWYSRLIVSKIINDRIAALPLHFPQVTPEQKQGLHAALEKLEDHSAKSNS